VGNERVSMLSEGQSHLRGLIDRVTTECTLL
jgi:hypothetical protein